MQLWRTKEMPLVAFLCLSGHNSVNLEYENNSVFWYFTDTDELRDDIDEYLQGEARVEPSAYNNQFARLRGEMFDYLRKIGVRTRTA